MTSNDLEKSLARNLSIQVWDFLKEDVDVLSIVGKYGRFAIMEDVQKFESRFFLPSDSSRKEKIFKERLSIQEINSQYNFSVVVSEFGYVFIPGRQIAGDLTSTKRNPVFYCLGHKDTSRIKTLSITDAIFRSKNIVRYDFSDFEGVKWSSSYNGEKFAFKKPPDIIVIEKTLGKNFSKNELAAINMCLDKLECANDSLPNVVQKKDRVMVTFINRINGGNDRYVIKKGISPSDLATFTLLRGRFPKGDECDIFLKKTPPDFQCFDNAQIKGSFERER